MPELPEVETVKRGLQQMIPRTGVLQRIVLFRDDLRFPIPKALCKKIEGNKLQNLERRGKYLLFQFPKYTLINHLGMTGSWREYEDGGDRAHDHIHLVFKGGLILVYNDPRRFGVLDACETSTVLDHKLLRNMGPDPTHDRSFSGDYLKEKARGRIVAVKNLIMDQKIVVGVGNIYASEALFRAGIKPQKRAHQVSLERYQNLARAIKDVLEEAIQAGGSTISDFRQAGGSEGYFQNSFKVYGRKGEGCVVCDQPIKMKVIGQRSSFYCSNCQK